jgi:hypothetical protein
MEHGPTRPGPPLAAELDLPDVIDEHPLAPPPGGKRSATSQVATRRRRERNEPQHTSDLAAKEIFTNPPTPKPSRRTAHEHLTRRSVRSNPRKATSMPPPTYQSDSTKMLDDRLAL